MDQALDIKHHFYYGCKLQSWIITFLIRWMRRKAIKLYEQRHDKTNKVTVRPDSDQPAHPPSLMRVFAVRMQKTWVLSYPLSAQRRLLSDWADAHADLSLRWAHSHFVGFVMSRLISRHAYFDLWPSLSLFLSSTAWADPRFFGSEVWICWWGVSIRLIKSDEMRI